MTSTSHDGLSHSGRKEDDVKGYKAFDPDWTCRGYQFKVGETYEENVTPQVCKRGFHFCEYLSDCYDYYDFSHTTRIAEIEALGEIVYGTNKCCTNKIHIVREVGWKEILDLVNIGRDNTGLCNTGGHNTGNHNSSYRNAGNYNSGHHNTGNCNNGSYNVGSYNRGSCNTGWFNSGCDNTGDFNLTSGNAGCFNTTFPTIPFFNKPSTWTINKWYNSNACCILRRMPMNVLQRQKWWDELPDSYKAKVMEIPNFNPQIFEEITGIKVN